MLKFLTSALCLCFAQTICHANQGVDLVDEYLKNSTLPMRWAFDSLKNFPIRVNDRVIDIGSGDGRITSWIAKQAPEGFVIGLDISDLMIERANDKYQTGNLIFIPGEATSIPFTETFDRCVSFNTLHYVVEQEQALESMWNCLKPGGTGLIVVPARCNNCCGVIGEELIATEEWIPYFHDFKIKRAYYSREEYQTLLTEAGFEIESLCTELSETFFADKETLVDWLRPIVTYTKHLEHSLNEEFLSDLADLYYRNEGASPGGPINVHHIKLEAIVSKRL